MKTAEILYADSNENAVKKVKFSSLLLDEKNIRNIREWTDAIKKTGYFPYQINFDEISEREYKKLYSSEESFAIQKNLQEDI